MDEEVWTKYRREDLYDEQGLQNGTGKNKIVVLTAPQPVLVTMSLRKGNVLAIKKPQLIPDIMDLQTKVVLFKELVV